MGFPAIYYNSKTLNFPYGAYRIQADSPRVAALAMAASRIESNLNVAADVRVSAAFRWLENANASNAALKRNLYQWFEWATQGRPWQFAMDSAKTVNTTLAQGANAGDTQVIVTSAAGIVANDQFILRSTTQLALVKVTGVAGTTLTIADTLDFAFVAGSRFRHEQYWPARLSAATKHQAQKYHAVQERPPLHYDVELDFVEDVN